MKRNTTHRLRSVLALALVLCLVLSLSVAAFADSADAADKAETSVGNAISQIFSIIESYAPDVSDVADYANDSQQARDSAQETFKTIYHLIIDDAALQNYVSELETTLPDTAAQLEDALSSIKSQLKDTESTLYTDIVDQLKSLADTLSDLENTEVEDSAKAAIREIQSFVNETLDSMEADKELLSELNDEIAVINSRLDKVNSALVDLNGNVVDMVSIIKSLANGTNTNYSELAGSAKGYVKAAVYAADAFIRVNNAAESAADTLEQISDDINGTYDKAVALYDKYTERFAAIRDIIAPLAQIVKTDLQKIAETAPQGEDGAQAKVAALQAAYDEYIQNVLNEAKAASEAANQVYRDQQAEIRKEINALYDELNAAGDVPAELVAKHDELVAQQSELKAQLVELRSQLKEASADTRDLIQSEIDEVEAILTGAGGVEEQLVTLNAQIEDATANSQTLVEQIRIKIDEAEAHYAEIEAKVDAQVAKYIGDANAQVDALNEELEAAIKDAWKEGKESFENAADIGSGLATYYAEQVDKAVAMLDSLSRDSLDELAALIRETVSGLKSRGAAFKDEAKNIARVVIATVNECKSIVYARYDYVDNGVLELINTSLNPDGSNKYFSIGDVSAMGGFASTLAEMLNGALDNTKIDFDEYTEEKLRVDEVLEMISDPANDVYNIIDSIKDADLITLSFNPLTYAMSLANDGTYKLGEDTGWIDWSKYIKGDGAKYVEVAIKSLEQEMIDQVNARVSGSAKSTVLDAASRVTQLIESYAFSYAAYLTQYPALVDQIHEINEDALVVIVGPANSFDGIELTYDGKSFTYNDRTVSLGDYTFDHAGIEVSEDSVSVDLGRIFHEVCNAIDAYFIAYTMNRLVLDADGNVIDLSQMEDNANYTYINNKNDGTGEYINKDTVKTVYVRAQGAQTVLSNNGIQVGDLKEAVKKALNDRDFDDLFAVLNQFRDRETLNAVTLTEAGNKTVAEAVFEALTLTVPTPVEPTDEPTPTPTPATPTPTPTTPSTNPSSTPAPGDAPKTGDESSIAVWAIVLVVCGAATVAILPRKKTNK